MLKKVSFFVAAVMVVTMLFAALPAFAEEEEVFDYVRFTALGNDPYATFTFSNEGNNTEIDPDTVTWAAIRYRTASQYDSTGVEYTAQFYICPAAEPCIPIKYNFSGNWETAIVDMTAVTDVTYLDSKWDRFSYTATNTIRFDPLEPDRDPEDTASDDVNGQVNEGDYIDVAWIAFFEKEEDARAYTGKEDTAYCLLDADSLVNISSQYHIEAEMFDTRGEPAAATEKPETTKAPVASDETLWYLYDKTGSLNTGWWIHPLAEDVGIDVEFTSDVWFKGIELYVFSNPAPGAPMTIYLLNDAEEVVWEKEYTFVSDNKHTIEFDDKTFAPGDYVLSFVSGDVSEITYDTWFVLGSSPALDDVDVAIMGGLTNDSTLEAPHIALLIGEADPNVTPAPTKEPTAAPTEAPTPVPTEKPADPTEAGNPSVDDKTAKPSENDNKDNTDKQNEKKDNKWLIIGIVCAAVIIAAAIAGIVIASAKKKKK